MKGCSKGPGSERNVEFTTAQEVQYLGYINYVLAFKSVYVKHSDFHFSNTR